MSPARRSAPPPPRCMAAMDRPADREEHTPGLAREPAWPESPGGKHDGAGRMRRGQPAMRCPGARAAHEGGRSGLRCKVPCASRVPETNSTPQTIKAPYFAQSNEIDQPRRLVGLWSYKVGSRRCMQ